MKNKPITLKQLKQWQANDAKLLHKVQMHEKLVDTLKQVAKYLQLEGENGTIAYVVKHTIEEAEGKGE